MSRDVYGTAYRTVDIGRASLWLTGVVASFERLELAIASID